MRPIVSTAISQIKTISFMKAVLKTAGAQGWSENQLYCEFFATEVAPSESDASFEVKLAN